MMTFSCKKIFLLTISLTLLLASPGFGADNLERLEVDFTGGYRQDQLDWNIAGYQNSTFVNVLSELSWSDLKIYQISTGGKIVAKNNHFPFSGCARTRINYGWIVDGENQDSDWIGQNRTLEFSRSNNNADDGSVFDFSLGGGLQFRLGQKITLAPLLGYSYHQQNLTMTDGLQTVSEPALVSTAQPLGPIDGLNSSYDAEWDGPWLGVDFEFIPTPRLTLTSTLEYHIGEYNGEANWNLRSDLRHPVSFTHYADHVRGYLFEVGSLVALTNNLLLSLKYNYQSWQAEDGIDTVYSASGGHSSTPLNEVSWESSSLNIGIIYRFN